MAGPTGNNQINFRRKAPWHRISVAAALCVFLPISISSDDPPYMVDVVQEYALALEEMYFTETELIQTARNAFLYSIKGQKYLPVFDSWVEEFIGNTRIKSH